MTSKECTRTIKRGMEEVVRSHGLNLVAVEFSSLSVSVTYVKLNTVVKVEMDFRDQFMSVMILPNMVSPATFLESEVHRMGLTHVFDRLKQHGLQPINMQLVYSPFWPKSLEQLEEYVIAMSQEIVRVLTFMSSL